MYICAKDQPEASYALHLTEYLEPPAAMRAARTRLVCACLHQAKHMPLPGERVRIAPPFPIGDNEVNWQRGCDCGEYGVEETGSGITSGGD